MNHLVFSEGKLFLSSDDSIVVTYRTLKLPSCSYIYRIERDCWYNASFTIVYTEDVPPIYRTLALLLS